jgi:hypothetical protein
LSSFSSLPGEVQDEIRTALRSNERQLGEVYRLKEQNIFTNREIVAAGAAANDGAAGNLRASIRAIVEDYIPGGPSIAAHAGRAIGGLLRDNPELSSSAKSFLIDLRTHLDSIAHNEEAVEREDSQINSASENLERSVEDLAGVYVYTLPTYYRTPIKSDPDRYWFKIGYTDKFVGARIKAQQRQTALPEDPWILRVYSSDGPPSKEMERIFHGLLEAAGHTRSTGRSAGREWFTTSLEFLDAIASALGYTIHLAAIPEE